MAHAGKILCLRTLLVDFKPTKQPTTIIQPYRYFTNSNFLSLNSDDFQALTRRNCFIYHVCIAVSFQVQSVLCVLRKSPPLSVPRNRVSTTASAMRVGTDSYATAPILYSRAPRVGKKQQHSVLTDPNTWRSRWIRKPSRKQKTLFCDLEQPNR